MTIVQGTTNERARVLTRKAHRLWGLLHERLQTIPDDGRRLHNYCETCDAIEDVSDLIQDIDDIRFGLVRAYIEVHDPKQDAIRSATSILRRLLPSLD